jgi:hypothetical protein
MRHLLHSVLASALLIAFVGPVLAQDAQWFNVSLSGANEVPGPGDADGSGTATVTLNPADGTICVETSFADIALPVTGAHIHEAPAGTSGGIVVPFIGGGGAAGPADSNMISACASASAEQIAAIGANPANYYLNLHNGEFGPGAIRGQLE